MGKKDDIDQLTNLLSRSLRHKIGSIVNENEIYAAKYAKDAENIMRETEKIAEKQNWNSYDKGEINRKLRIKLKKELIDKEFIGDKKFEIMGEEISNALKELRLN
jgi:hypothetical protein